MYGQDNTPRGLVPVSTIDGSPLASSRNLLTQYLYADENGQNTYPTSLFRNDPIIANPDSATAIPTNNANAYDATQQYGTVVRLTEQGNAPYVIAQPSTFPVAPLMGSFECVEYTGVDGKVYKQNYWIGGTQVKPGTPIIAYVTNGKNIIYSIQVSVFRNAEDNNFVAQPTFPNMNAGWGPGKNTFWGNYGLAIGGGTNFNTVPNQYINAQYTNSNVGYSNNPTTGNVQSGSAYYLCVDTSDDADGDNYDYDKTTSTLPLKAIGFDPMNKVIPGMTLQTTPFINVLVTLNHSVWVAGTSGNQLV